MQVRNAPITVQNVVTYDTVIGVNNADLKLKPGMTANVSIIIAHRDDAVKIKQRRACASGRRKLLPADSETFAWREPVSGGLVRARAIRQRANAGPSERFTCCHRRESTEAGARSRLGSATALSTEVIEGLKEGDRVVTGAIGGQAPNPTSARIRSVAGRGDSNWEGPSARGRKHPTNGVVVELDDVHKTYRTGEVEVHAVRGVSLKIQTR